MLVIRMRRMGSTKRPYFRVVVTESSQPRDSRFVEILGHYDPKVKPEKLDLNHERLAYWISKGAQPSATVRTLAARHPAPPPAAAAPAAESASAAEAEA
jgi:small subunit ribosomal protein S16